ncbi:transposase [Spirillospora sp. NPDC048824]|uniref:transposase n=1 Tax=Spirillospora sp. NPDC048824 TaxID=3364526 RepID=UPI00371AE586
MTSHDLPSDDGPRAGRPKRRTFSAAYKLRMVEEYEAAEHGDKGALLRREGLYESSIQLWRRQRDAGELTASGAAGPATKKGKSPEQAEVERLRKENERLARGKERAEKKLAQTEAALDIMGKGFALLEMMSERADNENS